MSCSVTGVGVRKLPEVSLQSLRALVVPLCATIAYPTLKVLQNVCSLSPCLSVSPSLSLALSPSRSNLKRVDGGDEADRGLVAPVDLPCDDDDDHEEDPEYEPARRDGLGRLHAGLQRSTGEASERDG